MNPSSCTSRQKPLKSKIDALKWANSLLEDYNLCLKILSIVLKKDKSYILAHINEKIKEKDLKKFKEIVKKLKSGIPLGYIIKEETFYGLKFKLKEGVFIPRPETEFLVQYVLNLKTGRGFKVLDIGTGSGAIAVSLKKFNKKLKVFASDISPVALFQAKKNAKLNKTKIFFFCGDLLRPLKGKFDIIISNPPYISKDFMKKLPKNVKKEPEIALYGGSSGLKFIDKILRAAKDNLKKDGLLIMEIGDGQFENVKELGEKIGYNFMDKIKDFSNIERIVVFKWSN